MSGVKKGAGTREKGGGGGVREMGREGAEGKWEGRRTKFSQLCVIFYNRKSAKRRQPTNRSIRYSVRVKIFTD